MITKEFDVVIVGGGPAGLTAAKNLATHANVLLIERESELGGIPRHCFHTGFGLRDKYRSMSGPKYAKLLAKEAMASGIEVMTNSMVTSWAGPKTLDVTSPHGRMQIIGKAIILATGARERPRTARRIPGARAKGIFNTGQLQQAVHFYHQKIGKRAVIVGSELVSWSSVLTLRHAKCKTALMITEYPKSESYWLFATLGRIFLRVKLRTKTRIVRVIGNERVTGIEIEDSNGKRSIVECDTVIFSGDWIADHELARLAGIEIDTHTTGPVVDTKLNTSTDGIFAIGNLVHPVDTADVAALDGKHVANEVISYLAENSKQKHQVSIECDETLAWVAPQKFNSIENKPARDRVLMWSNIFKIFPRIVIRQNGEVVARHRSIWPATPGRVFRARWSIFKEVDSAQGAITVGLE